MPLPIAGQGETRYFLLLVNSSVLFTPDNLDMFTCLWDVYPYAPFHFLCSPSSIQTLVHPAKMVGIAGGCITLANPLLLGSPV